MTANYQHMIDIKNNNSVLARPVGGVVLQAPFVLILYFDSARQMAHTFIPELLIYGTRKHKKSL